MPAPVQTPPVKAAPPAPPAPCPRKLRERLVFALIETSPTRVGMERADLIVEEAEKLAAYIASGDIPVKKETA